MANLLLVKILIVWNKRQGFQTIYFKLQTKYFTEAVIKEKKITMKNCG